MTAEGIHGILSCCYEGSVDREDIPGVTPAAECENACCVAITGFQRGLISSSPVD
jgi:hypothetical protein